MTGPGFWKDRRVFLTGHTGFKGSWLALWLASMGARVHGYSLPPPTDPSLFALASVGELLAGHTIGDVRDGEKLRRAMADAGPEIVFHLAAQPLVRRSYEDPVETYSTNVMGTVSLFEAVRAVPSVRAVVNVTSDKCYENREWIWGYRENEAMGGYDPYSSSKGCSELVTAAYRRSFFDSGAPSSRRVAAASARAGNVIGGGDFAADRLVPDCVRAPLSGTPVRIRNPRAVRPWQHVLEPLSGYLALGARLLEGGGEFAEGWNFGPAEEDARPVLWIVRRMCESWGRGASFEIDAGPHPHEAAYLRLDSAKARNRLGWIPRWGLEKAIDAVIEWTADHRDGKDVRARCLGQVREYSSGAPGTGQG